MSVILALGRQTPEDPRAQLANQGSLTTEGQAPVRQRISKNKANYSRGMITKSTSGLYIHTCTMATPAPKNSLNCQYFCEIKKEF